MLFEKDPFSMQEGDIMLQQTQPETLKQREQFFEDGVSILTHEIYCGDERGAENPADLYKVYIHDFGGVANLSYNMMVLQESSQPQSVESTFEETTASLVLLLLQAGIKAGVHSDNHQEHGANIDVEKTEGKVGCGYIELRQAISALIFERGDEILAKLSVDYPERYHDETNSALARKLIAAHGRLTQRNQVFTTGRQVALAAISKGAPSMVVGGDHIAKVGIINLRHGTTFMSGKALDAGLAAYNHDRWAAEEAFDKIHDLYPFDKSEFSISEDVDAVGTMLALGVEEICFRQ